MFDPDLFWQYAENLMTVPHPSECESRIAAGRAYYAFFLTARDRFENHHQETFAHDASDHSKVIRLLQNRNYEPLAEALRQLLRLREGSDYKMDLVVEGRRVSLAIKQFHSQYVNCKTI